MPHVLIVDDDPGLQDALGAVVTEQGFSFDSARSVEEARALLGTTNPDLILLDLNLPDGQGMELLECAAATPADVVLITGHATVDSAVKALREGATDYLVKPVDLARLQVVLGNVATRCELRAEVENLRSELRGLGRFGPLIGSSPVMQEVYDAISLVAPTDATVLILGDSGTGKELVAQAIHQLSRRRKEAFVAVNCGAISPQLIESELFGHERGAFTGAVQRKTGLLATANGGTVFLDEIGELSIALQAKLLRVLEDGEVRAVGADDSRSVDVRIIAATHQDLEARVKEGRFRADLFYRLNVVSLRLPPLRERPEDIPLLVEHFVERARTRNPRSPVTALAPEVVTALTRMPWPGNVRELENLIERLVVLGAQPTVDLSFLRHHTPGGAMEPHPLAAAFDQVVPLRQLEGEYIAWVVARCGGNKTRAAELLGIDVSTIHRRERADSGISQR